MVVSRVTLPHHLRHSTPRSITPRPDSFLPPPRPIARLHPRRPQSTFPSLHVFSTWQCGRIQTLEASHSYTCCAYTTHAPVSPHTRTRISTHAFTLTCRICPTKNFSRQNKENKHPPSLRLAGLCFPCPNEWSPRGHAYLHASMQNKTRAASRAFLCQCAHRPRVPIIIVATRCHRGSAAIVVVQFSCDSVRRSTELKQRQQKTSRAHLLPCPKRYMFSNPATLH